MHKSSKGVQWLTSASLWATIDIWLSAAPVSAGMRPMAICGRAASDIPAGINACRPVFRVIVPIAVCFGNKTSTNGRMCLSMVMQMASAMKNRKHKIIELLSWQQTTAYKVYTSKINILVARSTRPPVQWSICNFPSPSKTPRCGMCTVRWDCQTVHLLCRVVRAAPMWPFHPIWFGRDSPGKIETR